jgi:hypothetical protein
MAYLSLICCADDLGFLSGKDIVAVSSDGEQAYIIEVSCSAFGQNRHGSETQR